ncbi:MAG TPA: PAS domain S-box protein [Candidatus Ozemobacteraceae bacterium]|nr:PAS domain S-box protein [Candidatus Ozemobacteraceae bacterium]
MRTPASLRLALAAAFLLSALVWWCQPQSACTAPSLPPHLPSPPPLGLSAEERAWLAQNRLVRIGVTPDFPPYEFLDASGTLRGLVGDTVALVAHQLQLELVIEPDLPSWQHVMQALQSGKIDMVASAKITEERKQFMHFSPPLIELQSVVFTLDQARYTDFSSLAGKRLASLKGWADTGWVASNCPQIRLVPCSRVEDLFGQVLLQGADAGLLDIGSLGHYAHEHHLSQLSIAFTTPLTYSLAIGVRRDLDILARLVDRALKNIPPSTRTLLEHQWLKSPQPEIYQQVALILVALAVVLIGFVFWNIQLRATVNRRTAELERSVAASNRQTTALQESERKFRAVFNQTFEFMGMVSPDGILLAANRPALEFIGMDEACVVGRLFWETPWWQDLPQSQQLVRDAVGSAAKGEFARCELPARSRTGELSVLDFSMTAVRDDAHQILFLVPEGRDITDLKAAQAAAQEGEQRFRDLFELSPDPCLLIDQDQFIECNRAALRLLGFDQKNELVQKHPADISPPTQPDGRNSVDKAAEMTAIARKRGMYRFEWVHRRRDGVELFVEVTLATIAFQGRSMLYCQWRDLSERRQTQAALRESRALVSAALETLPFDFWMCDSEFRLTLQNPGSIQHWGQQLGHRLDEFLSPSTIGVLRADIQRALKGEFLQVERAFPRHNSTGWYRMILAPIRDNNSILGALGILIDITDRKQAEDEKQLLEQQIRQAQKIESIGRLAGGIAHDFNNYLTAILGNAELGRTELPPDHPSHATFQEIVETAQRASSLTRQLLTFSRKQPNQTQVLDLNRLLSEIRKMIERLIGEQIQVVFQTPATPSCIRADPGQMEQVLVNLAINARDAMPNGGQLSITLSHVDNPSHRLGRPPEIPNGQFICLSIRDTGIGMSEDIQQRVFEPFFTTKAAGKGTGLGLATVFGIIRQSGGWISLESSPGAGTTFFVYLPLVDASPADLSVGGPTASVPAGTPTRETIMLVEDEDSLRKLIVRFLTKQGYVVPAYPSGESALEALADPQAKPPALLITDVILPGITGRVLAEKLRQRFPELPVLFTSGYSDEVIETHGVFKDGLEFLPKPYTPYVLAQHVRKILDHASRLSEKKTGDSR